MSELPVDLDDELDEVPHERPSSTGVLRVDAVIDAVAALADQDLGEHVAVFEAAHAELRSTLDDPAIEHSGPAHNDLA